MFKRILVPTDGSESALVGLQYAAALARRHGACILGLFVTDIKLLEGPFLRDLSTSLGTTPYISYPSDFVAVFEERGRAALAKLEAVCAEAGVACDTKQTTGIVSRSIVEHGDLADLIVMGRGGEHEKWLGGLVGSTTEAVARKALRPVVVTGVPVPGEERFLVAYDGTHHARRALEIGAAITSEWGMAMQLLVVGGVEAEGLLEEARGYLTAHDIPVEYVQETGEPGEILVRQAKAYRADLVVMGAFGHSKVRGLVLGSTTSYVLNNAPCPVLLTR